MIQKNDWRRREREEEEGKGIREAFPTLGQKVIVPRFLPHTDRVYPFSTRVVGTLLGCCGSVVRGIAPNIALNGHV